MILLIDNYDSFTYNLVQYFGELKQTVKVFRNDKITCSQVEKIRPQRIVISPGPRTPKEAGISCEIIKHFAGKIPVLGVCLGHQCIGQAFGAKIVRAKKLMHGKTSQIRHDGKTIFKDIPNPFAATRYHSLVIKKSTLSADFIVTAVSEDNEIMAIKHKQYALWGVQFHPESILTKDGKKILANFLALTRQGK
ncbi:MAG: aminodeoxychorismate/anthranilate synthase component II [Candidatus Omnitrophica bacterium]|nr:aminodeoxychorismate/anthranilate synthase component II [Candidatus Omnitrophota bacterium]MCG2704023.1 aminodeoxychorismate/anthranilate synthase component II [Candidatus Omnitrophota bacterium]